MKKLFLCTIAIFAFCMGASALPTAQAWARGDAGQIITPQPSTPDKANDKAPDKKPTGHDDYVGNPSSSLVVHLENDTFTGTDRYYTNGVKLTWLSKDLDALSDERHLPGWFKHSLGWLDTLSLGEKSGENGRVWRNIGISFGQSIFTPQETDTDIPDPNDRPYAGWLYGSLALHSKTDRRLDTLELTLGIVGPSALGEEVQNSVHRKIGAPEANGWDYQLKDEPGIILTWMRYYRAFQASRGGNLKGFGEDLILHGGGCLGNVSTYAALGGEWRLGYNLPHDFGTSLIAPGGDVKAPSAPGSRSQWGALVFVGAEARAVARNIFLDGNTWQGGPHVSKEPLVADANIGVAVYYGSFKLTYATVFRSKEFSEQPYQGQQFGSLTLTYTF
jgi:hypothetical protein